MNTDSINKFLDEELRRGNVEIGIDIYSAILPPITRSVWSELPKPVRDILEREHGYNHYNAENDAIESNIIAWFEVDKSKSNTITSE